MVARRTPRVEGAVLVGRDGVGSSIAVGSPAWYAWLEKSTSFTFTSAEGGFTARKERSGASGWYWKAYRRRGSTLHRAYLGKSADLSLERLTAVAAQLAQRDAGTPPRRASSAVSPMPAATDDEATPFLARPLPTGTVTFCFTDIEGSAQLWEQHPMAMSSALARHDALLRQAFASHHGAIFKTVGDSGHAVFARATDALQAALTAQRALQAESWGATGSLQVRMALHTGVAEQRGGDYFGPALNRLARILALGHGGQILLSHATHDLVVDHLPPQTALRALGEYPLKDLSRPEPLFQLIHPDLASDFPPLGGDDAPPTPTRAQPPSLVATKLYVPPPRPQLVPRPHLVARVDAGLKGALTLLSAPAGFGKTTLLSAWRATAGSAVPLAWVSLEPADGEPTRFWSYVIAALDTIQPDIGATALALLHSPQPPPIDAILTPLLNALSALPADAVLVLEDYHLIDSAPVHSAVAFLLDHLPPPLHLVITTRADPPLPLTRLRARHQLTELRAADLRFTGDEATAFLTDVMGLPLTAEDVAALDARTEGWVAGLQLAVLAMRDRSDLAGFIRAFSGSNRFVVDYLAEEVLGRLPAHLQTFVMQTAILDQLCGSLCDALLLGDAVVAGTSSYSQVVLEQLERVNLFVVPLDDERRWYRYHHLFAEVLRARLQSGATADAVAALYKRASAWYEKEGLIGEAVRLAFQVNDLQRAAALIERHSIRILLDQSDVFLVRSWVERLPHALVIARPHLAVIAGCIVALTRSLEAVDRLLEEADPAFRAPDLAPAVVGELAALRASVARFRGDAPSTEAFAQEAFALLDRDSHALRALTCLNMGVVSLERGDVTAAKTWFTDALAIGEVEGQWIVVAALEELMSFQLRQGQLRQMLATAEESLRRSARRAGQQIPAAGMGYVGIAEVLYEWGDLDGAARAATQAVELLRRSLERGLLVRAYLVLARVHQARGDRPGAEAALRQCEEWFVQNRIPKPKYLALLAAHAVGVWAQHGDLETTRWAQEPTSVDEIEARCVQRLTLVRQWLAQSQNGEQRLAQASAALAQLLPAVEARGWMRYQIEGLVLQALLCQQQRDPAGAQTALQRALRLAEPEGYVRVFVDCGASMAAQLAQAAQGESPVAPYAAQLLDAFPQADRETSRPSPAPISQPRPLPASSLLVEPLSARELEVLHLIAQGHSNQAIADTLVIAVSTVKRHINNIYGKLDAQSRTQALVRARELHLL